MEHPFYEKVAGGVKIFLQNFKEIVRPSKFAKKRGVGRCRRAGKAGAEKTKDFVAKTLVGVTKTLGGEAKTAVGERKTPIGITKSLV